MINLTDEMSKLVDNAYANGYPCIVATASGSGDPDIGYKGSVMVFDSKSLAYWERTKRQHLKNLTENPRIIVLFRDLKAKVNWRFHGSVTIHESGPVWEQVMSRTIKPELEKDPERKGLAVIIDVDKVTTMSGQVVQAS